MSRLETRSHCKINLLLNILGTRPDGFHELETLMHPIALSDTLRIERTTTDGVQLACSHPALPVDSTNLVHRAATLFLRTVGTNGGVSIHLEKRIPLAAGLGGGSGNAAATLLALNDLFERPVSSDELQTLAAKLGSDVPFFLQPFPALATGRGERITAVDFFQVLRGLFILLVYPGFGVPTAWAYQALAQFPGALNGEKGRAERLIAELRAGELEVAASHLYNSLEFPVLRKYPILRLYQDFLREHGALATLMSGSGSTTFGLVQGEAAANELASKFTRQFGETCQTIVVQL